MKIIQNLMIISGIFFSLLYTNLNAEDIKTNIKKESLVEKDDSKEIQKVECINDLNQPKIILNKKPKISKNIKDKENKNKIEPSLKTPHLQKVNSVEPKLMKSEKKLNFSLGGNMSLGISGNRDFQFNLNEIFPASCFRLTNASVNNVSTVYFDQKMDYGNSLYAQIGYMLNPNMQIGIEAGYDQFKNNDSNNDQEYIKSKVIHSMINFTQYFDGINNKIRPYAMVGGGFAKVKAEGELFYPLDSILINFTELDKVTFAYQFGFGFETLPLKQMSFGFGYKYFATHPFETHDDNLNMQIKVGNQDFINTNNVSFGKLAHQNHMLNMFVKFNV